MATSQDFVNWTPTEAVTSDWLRLVFSASRDALIGFGKGSVHKTVYFPEWLAMHIALPPLNEQRRVVAEFDRQFTSIEKIEGSVTLHVGQLDRLRHSILEKAFAGSLLSQNPNDPPAGDLLRHAQVRATNMKNENRTPRRTRPTPSAQRVGTLKELLALLDEFGGSLGTAELVERAGLSEDVETFFDLLREGSMTAALSVPIGSEGPITKRSA